MVYPPGRSGWTKPTEANQGGCSEGLIRSEWAMPRRRSKGVERKEPTLWGRSDGAVPKGPSRGAEPARTSQMGRAEWVQGE